MLNISMLGIVAAEWRSNRIWMLALFALIGAVWLGVTFLPGQNPQVNLSILGMVSAFPLMVTLVVLSADQAEARRQQLREASQLPSTQLGIAHGLVLLSPWLLAMLNALLLGAMSAEAALPSLLFGWGGVLVVAVFGHWVVSNWAGRQTGMIAALVTIFAIFALEAGIIWLGGPLGWDFSFAADKRPSLLLLAWLREPATGILLYLLGVALAFLAIRRPGS